MPGMATSRDPYPLSPSRLHVRLHRDHPPALAFDPSDPPAWKRKLRRKLRQLVKMPAYEGPLRVRRLWRRDHELGTIEKIMFTAEPGADVPAYLCLPREAEPPYPVWICVQGHSSGMHNSIAVDFDDESKPIPVEVDRDFGLSAMRHGYAALCIEQRSFGERRELRIGAGGHTTCGITAMHALMLGRTLIGERVFDVDRGIDYLATRPDIDMKRLGVMGNSGGGTTSMFAAALLGRVCRAMPSCYFNTWRASIMGVPHCVCNYVPDLALWVDMADILGLFAPRPVTVVAGRHDDIFPVAATRRAFRDLKRIYTAFDAADRCKLVIGPEGHRFYADLAWPVMNQLVG
jgi:dienelactone hydrolase